MVVVAFEKNKAGEENNRSGKGFSTTRGEKGFTEGIQFAQDLKKQREWVLQVEKEWVLTIHRNNGQQGPKPEFSMSLIALAI